MEDIFTKNNTLCRGQCHHAGSGWQTIEDEDEGGNFLCTPGENQNDKCVCMRVGPEQTGDKNNLYNSKHKCLQNCCGGYVLKPDPSSLCESGTYSSGPCDPDKLKNGMTVECSKCFYENIYIPSSNCMCLSDNSISPFDEGAKGLYTIPSSSDWETLITCAKRENQQNNTCNALNKVSQGWDFDYKLSNKYINQRKKDLETCKNYGGVSNPCNSNNLQGILPYGVL